MLHRLARHTTLRSFSSLHVLPPQARVAQPLVEIPTLDLKTTTDLSSHPINSLAAALMHHAPTSKRSVDHKAVFDRVSHEILQRDLKKMKEEEMTTMLYTFATLRVKHSRMFEKLGEELSKRDLRRFQLENLMKIIHSYSTLHARNLDLFLGISRELGKRDLSMLPFVDCAALLHAFAEMRFRANKICNKISNDIKSNPITTLSVSAEAISNMLLGFAELEYKDKDLCTLFVAEIAKRNLSDFTVQDMTNLLFAFGKLDYRNNVLVERIAQELCSRPFKTFTFDQVAQCMWAFACLDVLELGSVQEFFTTKRISYQLGREKSITNALQVFQAKLAWAQQNPTTISPLVDSMFQEKWMMPALLAQSRNRKHHEVHREIANMLKPHFPRIESDIVTVLEVLTVDILLPSHKAIVQIDNAKRYFSNHTLVKNGSAMFRERLLERAGYEVISISEERFDQSDEEERELLINSIVRTLARRG